MFREYYFHWHYSPLWVLACRTMSFHFFLSATNSLHLVTPSTWRSLSTSCFHPFLGLPLLLVPSGSWVIFLGILSSSILSRWPNQLILCPFIHFTIFSPLRRVIFFPPMPSHVLCGLRGPPSWAWQECNRLVTLGRPWGAVTLSRWCVSGDRGGCSARSGLKPKVY